MNFFKDYRCEDGGDVVQSIHAVYKSFSEHVMDAARRGSLTVSFVFLPKPAQNFKNVRFFPLRDSPSHPSHRLLREQMTELDIFTELNVAVRSMAVHHNSKRWNKSLGDALVAELVDAATCSATDLYAFARREVLETLAVVVNPRKNAGCPESARSLAKLLASDNYEPGRNGHGTANEIVPQGTPSSLVAFWRAAESDGDAPAMRAAVESLVHATAAAGDVSLKLDDVAKCLQTAKSSFGALSRSARNNEIDFQSDSGRSNFEDSLDGVVYDYASGCGDAAPCKRVAAIEINVTSGLHTSGVSESHVIFWRRGISFRYAFEDFPLDPVFIDLSYASCLRVISTPEPGVVALGVREEPRGFDASDTFDAEDDRLITFSFDSARFLQAKSFLAKAAAEYPSAFGGGCSSFLARAASPLKSSTGVMCELAGPPKNLAPVRIGCDRAFETDPNLTCQTDLTSPRTMEALPANLPAPSPEPVFLTAKASVEKSPRHLDAIPESQSQSPSQSPKASIGISYGGSPSPSPISPSPTPSPTPSPPPLVVTTRTRQKAVRTEPAPAARRSTRFTKSEHKTPALAPAAAKAPPKAAPEAASRITRTTRTNKQVVEQPSCAAVAAPAPSRAPATSDAKPVTMKRKLGRPAKKVPVDVVPTTDTRAPLSARDEPNPPAKKARGRPRKPEVPEPEAPPAESAPAPLPVKKKTARGKAKPTEAKTAVDTTNAFEDFRLGNTEARDEVKLPWEQDTSPAQEATPWFSPKAGAGARRNVFARDGAAPKRAARRDRSKSPYPASVAATRVPFSPAASTSPAGSAFDKEAFPVDQVVAPLRRASPFKSKGSRLPDTAATSHGAGAAQGLEATFGNKKGAAPKKKGMLKAKGFETPQSQVSKDSQSLHRATPPTNLTVVAALEESDDEDDAAVPVAKAKAPVAKKPKTLLGALTLAPKTFERKGRVAPAPAVETESSESESESAPVSETVSESMEEDAVPAETEEGVSADAREAPVFGFDSDETEDDENFFKNGIDAAAALKKMTGQNAVAEAAMDDDHHASFGLKSHGRVEDSAKRPATLSCASSMRDEPSPFLPSPRPTASPSAQLAQTDPLDEMEQRARRAASAEADAWTSMEVPTLFKLSEKASTAEEKRKWEIILEIVLARKTGGTPPASPAAGPTPSNTHVSKGMKRPSPVVETLGDLLGGVLGGKRKKRKVGRDVGDDEPTDDVDDDAENEPESDDEIAALEKRLRSMRTTRKERAELEIAALTKTFKEETSREMDGLEVEARRVSEQVAQMFDQAETDAKERVGDVVGTLAAAHEVFKDATRDAREGLHSAEAVNNQALEEALVSAEAAREQLKKRAEQIKTRAMKKAEELTRVAAKKRKEAASGNSLKSLLLRLAENL